jgi:A/G-specific adenine glycosylase
MASPRRKWKIGDREFVQRLLEWFRTSGRDLPWRHTKDPYAILVSEFMLQQTQVATVLPYYERWLNRFPTAQSLSEATLPEVLSIWQGLGYYSRARNLLSAAKAVVEQGAFPKDPEAIQRLPGVGRYTASAVASFAFGQRVPMVEANIARVLARLHNLALPIDEKEGQAALWEMAERILPKKNAPEFNAALMELGALVCTPKKPQCMLCPVRSWCSATDPEALPKKLRRRQSFADTDNCVFLLINGKVMLEQETGKRLGGLWRLPRTTTPERTKPLLSIKYSIMHYRVTLNVLKCSKRFIPNHSECSWFPVDALAEVPMVAPHRRALVELLALSLPAN